MVMNITWNMMSVDHMGPRTGVFKPLLRRFVCRLIGYNEARSGTMG